MRFIGFLPGFLTEANRIPITQHNPENTSYAPKPTRYKVRLACLLASRYVYGVFLANKSMKKRNVCKVATIGCGLLSIAFSTHVDAPAMPGLCSQPIGLMLGLLSAIFATQWIEYQRRLNGNDVDGISSTPTEHPHNHEQTHSRQNGSTRTK